MSKKTWILGISCYYHDSAAALLCDGEIMGAVQEERFTRVKHDSSFPLESIKWLLKEFKIDLIQIDHLVYYEKPFITFERIIETHLNYAPWGVVNFLSSIPLWIKNKLFLERDIVSKIKSIEPNANLSIKYSEHHLSHSASAFYPSPYEEAAILCVDGVGEWATTSAWHGKDNSITPLWEIDFPHSLGLFYSAFTAYLGFKVNSGEYKVMGLAPYGSPKYQELILREILHLHEDGSYTLNMKYFDFGHKMQMTGKKFEKLFGRSKRKPETQLDDFHMDMAASLQKVLEIALIHVTKKLHQKTGLKNLCLAGGVALNCVANSKILEESGFENVWIQPAAGDAGGALGGALAYWYLGRNEPRQISISDSLKGSLLGPEFSQSEIESFLRAENIPFKFYSDDEIYKQCAELLSKGLILGVLQGKMEYGPRALGSRSIIADARVSDLQKNLNLKIKFRESFRPFAPLVLEEDMEEIFNWKSQSPYMLFVAPVKEDLRREMNEDEKALFGIDKLNISRSLYPAITHVDYSARLQTVGSRHQKTYKLLKAFKEKTGHGILVNTSFNVRGEPIVMGPEEAYRCFRRTDIDILVLENFIITKESLPEFSDTNWRDKYELD